LQIKVPWDIQDHIPNFFTNFYGLKTMD
jgi:hypothetical protein